MRFHDKYSTYNKYLIIFANSAVLVKNVKINSRQKMIYTVLGPLPPPDALPILSLWSLPVGFFELLSNLSDLLGQWSAS